MKLRYAVPLIIAAIVAVAVLSAVLNGHDETQPKTTDWSAAQATMPIDQHEISKACVQYILTHFDDPKGVPINHCTVDFMPGMNSSRNYQALLLGMPVPAPMTCDISGCYLVMK